MRVIRARQKIEMLAELNGINGDESEVYISMRPTLEMAESIIKQSAVVRKVLCPQSLHRQVSKRVLNRFGDAGIQLEPGSFSVGRPVKYETEVLKQILLQKNAGKPARTISTDLNVPLRTVYFYLKNGVKD